MDAKKLAALFDNQNFARWFGNSKAASPGGHPVVLYHGSNNGNVKSFDPSLSGKNEFPDFGKGAAYLTDDPHLASGYAMKRGGEGQSVYPVFASIQNPEIIYKDKISTSWKAPDGFTDTLKSQGKDGVIVKLRDIDDETGEIFDEYLEEVVPFYPEQIKSIFNRGTFDPNDPNILKSIAPYALAGGGLMSALSPSDAAAIESIRQKDAPLEEAWNPVEAFGGGLGGGLRAALAGIIPDGVTDWAINGLMSGGK